MNLKITVASKGSVDDGCTAKTNSHLIRKSNRMYCFQVAYEYWPITCKLQQ